VALTLTAKDRTLTLDGARELAASISRSHSAVRLDYTACGLGDGSYSALGTSEKNAVDFHVRLLSKHPAVISAARVGCSGAGRMGTDCDYQCPARWLRTGGSDMHAIHSDATASSRHLLPSLGGRSVDVPVARHAGNDRLDKGNRVSSAVAKAVKEDRRESTTHGTHHGPETELYAHEREVDRLRTIHVFKGPASERHTASGSLQGCHSSCRYSVKLASHECGKWAADKSDEDALHACRAAIDEDVPKYCSVTRASCAAAHSEAVALGQPPIYTTTAARKPDAFKEGCEPCGYLLHYHGHDIDGAGGNSLYDSISHENHPDFKTEEAEPRVDDSRSHLLALSSGGSKAASSGRYAGNAMVSSAAHLGEVEEFEVRTFARVVGDMFPSCHAQAGTNSAARCSPSCTKGVQTVLDTCLAWASKERHTGNAKVAAVACTASAGDAAASCGKAGAAQCVEPVMRGFNAMGLKRAVGPEASRRDGSGFMKGKVTSIDDNASAAVDAASATLGGATPSLPAHIIATASPLRATSLDDDVVEGETTTTAHTPGVVEVFGVSLSSPLSIAAMIGFSTTVLVAAALFMARRVRRAHRYSDVLSIDTPLLSGASGNHYGGTA
jgi:hypothetical protein